jgi:hypothetical protein
MCPYFLNLNFQGVLVSEFLGPRWVEKWEGDRPLFPSFAAQAEGWVSAWVRGEPEQSAAAAALLAFQRLLQVESFQRVLEL